jgi:hypothetical protein
VATEAQPAKQAKLLIVDENVMIRMLLGDMLCEIGYGRRRGREHRRGVGSDE